MKQIITAISGSGSDIKAVRVDGKSESISRGDLVRTIERGSTFYANGSEVKINPIGGWRFLTIYPHNTEYHGDDLGNLPHF